MRRLKYLAGNLNLLNVLLAGVLLFFSGFLLLPLISAKVRYSLPAAKKQAVQGQAVAGKTADPKNPSPSDYVVIAEQNLFHPERKIPEVKAKTEAPPLPKPDFVLTGTLLMDNLKLAYLLDKKAPVNTPGRQNRQTTLRVGDTLSGFILKEIQADKVVMQRGEEKMVVLLNDSTKARDNALASAAPVPGAAPLRTAPRPPAVAERAPRQAPFVPTQPGTHAVSAQPGTATAPASTAPAPTPRRGPGFFNWLRR